MGFLRNAYFVYLQFVYIAQNLWNLQEIQELISR